MSRFMPLLLFAGVFFVVYYLIRLAKKENKKAGWKQYDERQLLIQGKAYKYAFFTAILYVEGVGIYSLIAERDFATTYAYACIGL